MLTVIVLYSWVIDVMMRRFAGSNTSALLHKASVQLGGGRVVSSVGGTTSTADDDGLAVSSHIVTFSNTMPHMHTNPKPEPDQGRAHDFSLEARSKLPSAVGFGAEPQPLKGFLPFSALRIASLSGCAKMT